MNTEETRGEGIVRRPLQSRNTRWAAATARWLGQAGFRPNQISLLSMVFGLAAGTCLYFSGQSESLAGRVVLLLSAAVSIQLRLLCNLFDGMVAVEGGFKTKSGEVYNELPDRFSDVVIFLGAGYSAPVLPWMVTLGWSAALLAVMTAYVRAFGGSAGVTQPFCGPMAKPHRMFVMTMACVLAALVVRTEWPFEVLRIALMVVVAGSVVTIFRRTVRIMAELEGK